MIKLVPPPVKAFITKNSVFTLGAYCRYDLSPMLSIESLRNLIGRTSQTNTEFRLIDTFTHELVRAQAEQFLDLETTRRQKLQETLAAQLAAALREHLQTPYHTDANEIDLVKFAAGQLHVFHRYYHNRDLREHCQEAINISTGVRRARYEREKQQLEILYTQKIVPELENFSQLVPARATVLSWEVRQAYGLATDEEIFLGQKHGLVMPANQQVYTEGFAYVNLHQLVYLPRQQKALVTIDQYFAELTYSQLRQVLNDWQPRAILSTKTLTEKLLMETIVTLPAVVRTSQAFDLFAQAAQKLDQSLANYHQKQQYSHAFIQHSNEALQSTAAWLTHILLLEYQLCQRFPAALKGLSQRLQVAFEMAAHPLLGGQSFVYQASLAAYTDQFLNPWLKSTTTKIKPSSPNQLLKKLEGRSFIRSTRHNRKDPQLKQQRNQALLQLSHSYPGILTGFLSKAQCAAGSVGGLSKMNQAFNSPLAGRVLHGYTPSLTEVRQLVGNRAERWQRGICINPHCPVMHRLNQEFDHQVPHSHLPYVGECQLCLQCELEYQQKESKKTPTQTATANDLARFGQKTFTNTSTAVDEYLQLFGVPPSLLPTYFLAPRAVENYSAPD